MSWLINEVSRMTGVSAYNLRYYEEEGLLSPGRIGDSNYRSYDDADIRRIYCISLYRQLGVSIKEMKTILDESNFYHKELLDQVIAQTNDELIRLEKIKSIAEFLRVFADGHSELDEEKQKEQAKDYEDLVVILGKRIKELNEFYEERARKAKSEDI